MGALNFQEVLIDTEGARVTCLRGADFRKEPFPSLVGQPDNMPPDLLESLPVLLSSGDGPNPLQANDFCITFSFLKLGLSRGSVCVCVCVCVYTADLLSLFPHSTLLSQPSSFCIVCRRGEEVLA